MRPIASAAYRRRVGFATAALAAGVAVPVALAATSPPVKSGHYRGLDSMSGTVILTVSSNGENFTTGRFNLNLLGQAGRGSCVGPAHVTLSPTRSIQITAAGTFDLSGTFPFREQSPDPAAFRGTGHAVVRGTFSDGGKRVTGTVTMTASEPHLTCTSGIVHFSAGLV